MDCLALATNTHTHVACAVPRTWRRLNLLLATWFKRRDQKARSAPSWTGRHGPDPPRPPYTLTGRKDGTRWRDQDPPRPPIRRPVGHVRTLPTCYPKKAHFEPGPVGKPVTKEVGGMLASLSPEDRAILIAQYMPAKSKK